MIVPMRRLAPLLAALALAACTEPPTFGERLATRGVTIGALGEQWSRGDRMVERGERLIAEGESLVRAGERKQAAGRRLVQQGERLMRESERAYRRETGATTGGPGDATR